MPDDEVLRARLGSQLLAGPRAKDPVAVAERLLAVQGQDQRAVRLAVRVRTRGGSVADIERALSDERSLLITWVNRGTLHLIRTEDYPLLQLLTTPQLLTANSRRLAQEGVSPDAAERGVEAIVAALADAGAAELARRYLVGHQPADDRDLARWAGLPLRDAREFLLGAHVPAIIVGGLFRPFALVGGRAAASWKWDAGRVVLEALEPIDAADLAVLEADGEAVRAYLGVS
jgi:hypothetical protein